MTLVSGLNSALVAKQDAGSYATTTDLTSGLATRQSIITGAATTIVSDDLTASRVVVTSSAGKLKVHSSTSNAELGYLAGATSSIQGQLDVLAPVEPRVTTLEAKQLQPDHRICLKTDMAYYNHDVKDGTVYCRWRLDELDTAISFTGGITSGANSLVIVNSPGHYTISTNVSVSSATGSTDRAVVYLALRTYVGQGTVLRGTLDYEYALGTAYYRGYQNSTNYFNLGGSATIYIDQAMVDAGFQLEVCTVCMGSTNTSSIYADRAASSLRVERLTYRII